MHRLAPIERLPVEILQEIFLLCPNVELPHASPIIGAALSNEHIYTEMCDNAFPKAPATEDAQKQKYVMSRRWMTFTFFRQYVFKRTGIPYCDCWRLYDSDSTATAPHACESSSVLNPDNQDRSYLQKSRWLLPWMRCSLPTKLLHGPWTDEKLSLLDLILFATPMSVDRADKEALRLVAQGKREAIQERNRHASFLFSRLRRLGRAPTLGLIKFAIIEANCDRSIVFELMSSAREWGLRRWNDVELDAWCAQEEARGNPKGRWVKIKLEELRAGKAPNPDTGRYEDHDVLEVRSVPFRTLKPIKMVQASVQAYMISTGSLMRVR